MWSWDTEARMKKNQSNDPRREERKQKKNKEHFIHIGPKLEAAREN